MDVNKLIQNRIFEAKKAGSFRGTRVFFKEVFRVKLMPVNNKDKI
jgi:hypothetical protein